jgi:hypothetical protein
VGDLPATLKALPEGYAEWLADVKARVHAAQQRAAQSLNQAMLGMYWQLGREILERQAAKATARRWSTGSRRICGRRSRR